MSRNPICSGCEADIESVIKPGSCWTITVTSPDGRVGAPQPFCLSCMVKLAGLGIGMMLATRSGAW